MCFRWVVSACVVVQLLASGSRSATAPEPKPVAKATAEQFVKEAVADPAAAEKKFKGKIIELTGPVSSTDGGLLTVKAGKLKPNDLFGLFAEAEVSAGQKDAVQMFAQDQKIQVTGELKSVSKDRVRLTNCKVKELERNPLPTVKAADLAAAYVKSQKDAEKLYGSQFATKELFVTGTVAAVKAGEYNTLMNLTVPGQLGVMAILSKDQADKFKQGDTVLIKGVCRGVDETQHSVMLSASTTVKK